MSLPQPPDEAANEAKSTGHLGESMLWSAAFGTLLSSYRTLWAYYELEQKKVASLESEIRELRAVLEVIERNGASPPEPRKFVRWCNVYSNQDLITVHYDRKGADSVALGSRSGCRKIIITEGYDDET